MEIKEGVKCVATWRKSVMATATSALLAGSVLAGCGTANNTTNATGTPGKPFAGQTLTIVLANHPWQAAIQKMLPDFESQTGMKVKVQSYFETQLSQKLSVQFTAGSTTPDVFMYRPLQEGKQFFNNGWIQPLNDYVSKDAAWNWDDFSTSSRGTATVNQQVTGVPIVTEEEVLYYRKDLFQQAGLQPPKTIDDMVADAKKLNNPSKGIYGFIARGQRSAAVTQESSYLYSYGGDWDKDGKAAVNSPEALQAFTTYGNLLKNYAPPGVLNMSWPEAAALFAQGKVAMWTDASSIYQNVTDPTKSTVANNVGYAVFPAGPAGSKPYAVTSWGLAMNKSSKEKDAAWEFIKWATSAKVVAATQAQGNPGARQSVWNSADGGKGFPAELADVIKQSSTIGVDHDRPLVVNVGNARDIVGNIVESIIEGKDAKAAADAAQKDYQALLDKEGSK
jgi:multiple sugar transport system substrate-binding protein